MKKSVVVEKLETVLQALKAESKEPSLARVIELLEEIRDAQKCHCAPHVCAPCTRQHYPNWYPWTITYGNAFEVGNQTYTSGYIQEIPAGGKNQ